MRLVDANETKRVELPDGWVEIKARMPVGDLMKLLPGRSLEEVNSPTPELMVAILQQAIVAWSMEEPVTDDNVALLDFKDAALIMSEVGMQLWGDVGKEPANGSGSPPAVGPTN